MAPIRTQQISGNIDVDNLTVHAGLLVDSGAVITGVTMPATAPYTITGAPPANANQAALQVGGGVFGGGGNTFSGAAAGTGIGVNLPLGSAADLFNFQIAGAASPKIRADSTGLLYLAGSGTFTGIQYLDNTAALAVFTGYNNAGSEFRVNNVSAAGLINFMIATATKLQIPNGGGIRVAGDPTGAASFFGVSNVTGIGNGAQTAVTAPLFGTGTGPATPTAVAQWLKVYDGTTTRWVPMFV